MKKLVLRFSEGEKERLDRVAERVGMGTGAWGAEMLDRYARGLLEPIPADWRDLMGELLRWRSELAQVHMLLKSLVARAEAAGESGQDAGRMLARVERMLDRADEVTEEASRRVSRQR